MFQECQVMCLFQMKATKKRQKASSSFFYFILQKSFSLFKRIRTNSIRFICINTLSICVYIAFSPLIEYCYAIFFWGGGGVAIPRTLFYFCYILFFLLL
jgi:hypothetical protein